MAQTYELERVSDKLQQILNQEARNPSADRRDEVATLMNSEHSISSYNACVWWDGCYYCQDESKNWYCVKCCFF